MTSPASVIVFALPGDVLGPALCGCDSNPKDRRPRSTPQLSQRDIATRTSTDASAAAKKQYQPHKPSHPSQHDKFTSLIRRTRRLTDIRPSKLCRMTSDPSNCLAWISDPSMGTPTSSLCPRRPPHILSDLNVLRATFPHPITEARESGWRDQMESLAEGLGSVVRQQIGRFMEATSQTQGMSAHPTGDRSHSWASTASHCRIDETGVPLGPSQIDENMGTRASLRYGTMEPMLKTASDSRSSCTIASNDSLPQKALALLGGVYTDTSHQDASKSWLWLRLPLEIWKGVLQLNVAALLLHGIIHEQLPSTHDPSVDQNTWLEKEENSNSRLSRGGESRTDGRTPSHNGQSSTGVKRRIATPGGVDSDGDNDDNDGDDDNDDKDGDRGNEQVVSKRRRSEANSKRLACPYLKYNPRKYESEKSCMGPGWATVHRVK
ncbi:hypothetical protein EDB81DRAFT_807941 [Dactylonectria macrodidyma]|uniref:Uncharacterized protein n=1 Tax=Dactylonectria macrodidyma TaxID=307937 RepID=A0A9P9E4W6_9HYPO|nr:hypothetical protein EDB81DRAFT_807941 [Dactylonectria macrodidyma]